jgi:hypothetical protein
VFSACRKNSNIDSHQVLFPVLIPGEKKTTTPLHTTSHPCEICGKLFHEHLYVNCTEAHKRDCKGKIRKGKLNTYINRKTKGGGVLLDPSLRHINN